MASLFDEIDAAATESQKKDSDLFSQIDAAASEAPKKSLFDEIDEAAPTSGATSDFFQRLGENLWRGLGNLSSGLDRLDERLGLSPTEESYRKKIERSGRKVDERLISDLRARDEARRTGVAGKFLASVADTGTRRTDPSRDGGIPALAADIIGGVAPSFLLGPAAPVGMGAMISDQERQRALAEGQSQQEAQARGDLGFSVGTAASLVPVVGRSIATKALTGAAGNVAGDVAIEAAQGRTPDANSLKTSAGIGALFGAATGVQQRVSAQRSAPVKPKGPSLVEQMDSTSHGTPAAANVAANEIAMQAPEPVAPPPLPEAAPAPAKPVSAPIEETKVGKISRTDKANYEAYIANKEVFDKAIADHLADPTNPELEAKFQEAFRKNEEIKNRNGGFAPEPPNAVASNLLEADNFDTAWKDQGGLSGSENQVVIQDGVVYKRNYNQKLGQNLVNFKGDINAFNESVAMHNELFPSTKMDIIGMSETSDGPAPVIAQAEIKGKPASPKEIKDFMAKKGFEPDKGPNFINKEVGVIVEDLRPANVLKDANGDLHVIDSIIKKVEPEAKSAPTPKIDVDVEARKAYIDELLATKEITKAEHASQLAELGIKPEAKPITVPAAQPVAEFVIPKELSKSNPRYKTSEVKFEDPLDKALYIIAQDAKRSARDADFLDLVMQHTGMDEAQARAAGQQVRNRIRALSDAGDGGPITLNRTKQTIAEPSIPDARAPDPQSPVDAPVAQQTAPTDAPVQSAQPQTQAAGGGAVPPGQVPAPSPAQNNPIPNYGWTPFISKTKAGEWLKQKIGTIEGNIRKVLPEAFGALRERGFKINELKFDWSNSSRGYGRDARRFLKPEAFAELDRLLQSGLHEEAAAFIKGSRHEAELTNAINSFKKTLDAIRAAEINAGREVGLLDNYWIRQVADYEGLRKALGRDPSNAAEKAIKAAEATRKRKLTAEEEQKVINDLIATSFSGQGKPGFLNPRTIGEIKKDWYKYYEPSDVAIEQRINRVATDVVDRAYFGKFNPEGLAHSQSGHIGAIEGSFGQIINNAIKSGQLSPEASRVVVRNLQDFLRSESGYNEVTNRLATAIRKGQTYGYLSDLSSAIPQFGDFFLSAWRNGFLDAEKGFNPLRQRKVTLDDIKLHQGTPDTAIYSKRNREGLVGSVFRKAVQTSIGLADGFNKNGSINVSFKEAARDMNNVNSDTYKRLDRKWSERFPNRWPDIKKDLQSKAFQDGDLNPNTQFFLYSELADIQPISGESYAQGYHQASPMGKIVYGLRSFAIKQLDVMRETGYENLRSKDPALRAEGLKNLVTYALVVGIGQQFLSSYMRDVLFGRETKASEYGLSGLMSLVGLNRYFIYRAGDTGFGTAALETLVPGVGIVNDIGQSAKVGLQGLTGQRNKTTGMRTVPDIQTALSKMQAIKYIPFIGRGIDAYLGPGAERKKKQAEDKAKGKPQKSTIQQIEEALIPPDVAR